MRKVIESNMKIKEIVLTLERIDNKGVVKVRLNYNFDIQIIRTSETREIKI